MAAEDECQTPLIPKLATGHDPELVPPPPILTSYSKIYLFYTTTFSLNR
jgi:hypothetical protein